MLRCGLASWAVSQITRCLPQQHEQAPPRAHHDETAVAPNTPLSSDDEGVTCAVCLDTVDGILEALPCSHVFHSTCIERTIQSAVREARAASCPLCECTLAEPARARRSSTGHGPQCAASRAVAAREDEQLFLSAAVQIGLKLCPACGAAIEKRRGCDHMTCHCGCHFSWSRAQPVAYYERGVLTSVTDAPLARMSRLMLRVVGCRCSTWDLRRSAVYVAIAASGAGLVKTGTWLVGVPIFKLGLCVIVGLGVTVAAGNMIRAMILAWAIRRVVDGMFRR